jgi:hypothetical protein
MMGAMKPQMLCWLTCDAVHIDPATGKHYILGVFSHLGSRTFPFRHPRMFFLLTLAGLTAGRHNLKIAMGLPMEEQKTIVARDFDAVGPMQKINLLSEIQGLGFPVPGNYAISIDIDDENLIVTTLPVLGPGSESNN